MPRIAAVTVLFNPGVEELETVASYARQVTKCFLVDNSSTLLAEALRSQFASGGFGYRHMGSNVGPAAALNAGIVLAMQEGFQFVLTMDQDSRCTPGMVELLHEVFLPQDASRPPVAIACPNIVGKAKRPRAGDQQWTDVPFCITSGSLIDTKVWEQVSGFDESLFIDHIDHEYCLRVRAAGYRIVCRHDTLLDHHTGNLRQVGLMGFRRTISVHNPDRLFYVTRNGLLLISRYGSRFPEVGRLVKKRLFAQALKSVLFGPQRWRRMAFMLRGYRANRAGEPSAFSS